MKNKELVRLRHKKSNKGAFNVLKDQMVTHGDLKLHEFRQYYKPVLSSKEKEILMKMKIDPFSPEGLKYVGDCKRAGKELGEKLDGGK